MTLKPNNLYSKERIEALKALNIMDTPYEKEYDEVVKLAVQVCGASSSVISLLDDSRQWYKAKIGVENTETPAEESFCKLAIEENEIFEVEDATLDARFLDNPHVVCENGVRFYAGTQLTSPNGYNVGMLCVMDTKPNKLSADQRVALYTLGQQVVKQFELRMALNQIESQRKELEKLIGFKNKVFAVIAHDLRSPIANVQQILNLYDSEIISQGEFMSFIETLKIQVKNTETTLTNLMSWANAKKTEPAVVEISKVVDQIAGEFKLNLQVKKLQLEVDYVTINKPLLLDQDGLLIVLRNVISNAVKFSFDQAKIVLKLEVMDGYLVATVQDFGKGIPESMVSKLMDPSEHTSTYGTANEKGTGLGLLVCKEIVTQNQGDISVTSTPEKGTTVKFTLKLA